MLTGTSEAENTFAGWIGKTETAFDRVTSSLVGWFRAAFDLARSGDEKNQQVPPGLHWCLCANICATSQLSPDGHPPRGDFLPPVQLPRRMWAGGELRILAPLRVGDVVRRNSVVETIQFKQGRSGPLCFVTVLHDYATASGSALQERQDIVYRGPETDKAQERPIDYPGGDVPQRHIKADSTLLFRYSALTQNSHKIHYDREYSRNVEGYPGLVVHGPLQATLLLQYAIDVKGGKHPRSFSFRSEAPLFESDDIRLNARHEDGGLTLWTSTRDRVPAMKAHAKW